MTTKKELVEEMLRDRAFDGCSGRQLEEEQMLGRAVTYAWWRAHLFHLLRFPLIPLLLPLSPDAWHLPRPRFQCPGEMETTKWKKGEMSQRRVSPYMG